jgi:hypothetical protein
MITPYATKLAEAEAAKSALDAAYRHGDERLMGLAEER